MSQFPQQGFQQQPAFGQPQPQGFPQQGFQQPQGQFQNRPAAPQLPQVPMGQGYAPGQFPYENVVHMVGQVFPNQYVPNGLVFSPSQSGGVLRINVKLRQTLGRDQSKVKITFVTLVAFGQLAQQLQNSVRAGQLIKFTAEYQASKYMNKRTNRLQNQIQFVLQGQQGQSPIQVIGELPLYDEVAPPQQQGGGQWNNGGGQAWGGQQQQAPQQQWQQPAPAQNFQQQQPAPGQWGQQPAPQQQAPAPQQGQWQQPQAQPQFQPQAAPQQLPPAQPQFAAPGQQQQFTGSFAPPGAAPMTAPQGAPVQQMQPQGQPIQGQPMQGQPQGGLPGLGTPPF